MWDDPDLRLAEFTDLLLTQGFVQVGESTDKITYQAPTGGRMELPRRATGRVFRSHVERAARLLHISTSDLLAKVGVEPAAADTTNPVLTAADATKARRAASTDSPTSTPQPPPRPDHVAQPAGRKRAAGSHTAAVVTLLADKGGPMDFDSMVRALTDRGHPVTRDQVRQACSTLARDGALIRPRPGVYKTANGTGSSAGRLDIAIQPPEPQRTEPPAPQQAAAQTPRGKGELSPEERFERCFPDAALPTTGAAVAAAAEWFDATQRLLGHTHPAEGRVAS